MLIQHDLRVISKYYSTLRLARVAELLRVEPEACEDELCVLNNAGAMRCRIDRIDGVVDFTPI
jgi:26S proteasome regulatory subunit N5